MLLSLAKPLTTMGQATLSFRGAAPAQPKVTMGKAPKTLDNVPVSTGIAQERLRQKRLQQASLRDAC